MKINKIIYFLLALSIFTLGCAGGGPSYYDLNPVKDSLGYKKVLGTYIFKPTGFQAERLKIDSNQVITLKITTDSLIKFNSTGVYQGKYYIDKMILDLDSMKRGAYSSKWSYTYNSQTGSNLLLFEIDARITNDSFAIEKSSDSDTLHITGYAPDPKYEVFRFVDFKKIN